MPFFQGLNTCGSVSRILKWQISKLLAHFLAPKLLKADGTILCALRDEFVELTIFSFPSNARYKVNAYTVKLCRCATAFNWKTVDYVCKYIETVYANHTAGFRQFRLGRCGMIILSVDCILLTSWNICDVQYAFSSLTLFDDHRFQISTSSIIKWGLIVV